MSELYGALSSHDILLIFQVLCLSLDELKELVHSIGCRATVNQPVRIAISFLLSCWSVALYNGLIQVKEEGWRGFSEGWQGCSEGFPECEARGKSRRPRASPPLVTIQIQYGLQFSLCGQPTEVKLQPIWWHWGTRPWNTSIGWNWFSSLLYATRLPLGWRGATQRTDCTVDLLLAFVWDLTVYRTARSNT